MVDTNILLLKLLVIDHYIKLNQQSYKFLIYIKIKFNMKGVENKFMKFGMVEVYSILKILIALCVDVF